MSYPLSLKLSIYSIPNVPKHIPYMDQKLVVAHIFHASWKRGKSSNQQSFVMLSSYHRTGEDSPSPDVKPMMNRRDQHHYPLVICYIADIAIENWPSKKRHLPMKSEFFPSKHGDFPVRHVNISQKSNTYSHLTLGRSSSNQTSSESQNGELGQFTKGSPLVHIKIAGIYGSVNYSHWW